MKDKPDTKVKGKPDTKVKDKLDTKVKDKPDTSEKKDKPDTIKKKDNNQKLRDNSQKIKREAQVIKNQIVDQVNLIAKISVDYLANANEIVMLINKLYDDDDNDDADTNTTLLKLNKINALLDKSLDCAWKLCGAKKIKKH